MRDWFQTLNASNLPEEDVELDAFLGYAEKTELNHEIVFCLIADNKSDEFKINIPFYEIQKILSERKSEKIFQKAVFGDGKVYCISLQDMSEEDCFFLDADAKTVKAYDLLITANAILRERQESHPTDKRTLIILRETGNRLVVNQEWILQSVFGEERPPYQVIVIENKEHNDWLDKYADKYGVRCLFENVKDVLGRI